MSYDDNDIRALEERVGDLEDDLRGVKAQHLELQGQLLRTIELVDRINNNLERLALVVESVIERS